MPHVELNYGTYQIPFEGYCMYRYGPSYPCRGEAGYIRHVFVEYALGNTASNLKAMSLTSQAFLSPPPSVSKGCCIEVPFSRRGLMSHRQTPRRPRRPFPRSCTRPVSAIASSSNSPSPDSLITSPLSSLRSGTWFKLICGASSHDAPSICNLCAIYTAVGADCIDVACDHAIIRAARTGIYAGLPHRRSPHPPLLMVSVNAAADPHFRKAEFVPTACPPACARPCETVCPAAAIDLSGVVTDRCYGCGRCVPVCPPGIIDAVDHVHNAHFVTNVLAEVDAVEIHTGPGQEVEFQGLWAQIEDAASRLKVVAVSRAANDVGCDECRRGIWRRCSTIDLAGGWTAHERRYRTWDC